MAPANRNRSPYDLPPDTIASLTHVSKKYCMKLKRSLAFGVQDIARELLGYGGSLTLRKDEFLAVDDVSFDLKAGESVALMGRNGSGKSTTLKLIAGLLKPDAGTVAYRGRLCPLIELGTGFNPILSGRENVYINASVHGIPGREVKRLFDRIVEFAEIGDFIDSPLRTYSSGMTVRLGFAIATQLKPDLLIVDEVLAVGDLAFKAKCMKHLQSLKAEGTSIVLVSHQPGHSAQLCDRTIVFDRGKIIADLPVEEGIEAYQKLLQLSAEAQALADGEMPAKETPVKRRRKKTMNGRRRRRSRTLVAEGGAVAAGEVALRRRRRTM
jgi:lipopolysaccharide transport system ATP-binding protein